MAFTYMVALMDMEDRIMVICSTFKQSPKEKYSF